MAEKQKADHEPWSPTIRSTPLFINSADYERSLAEEGAGQAIEIADEGTEPIGEPVSTVVSDPTGRPLP
jgi:hypothetical protein